MTTLDLIQRSPEWYAARCGSLGASQVHEALARTKSGWGESRANIRAALVAERLTGVPVDSYMNAAMRHGIDTEPKARAAYSFFRDREVREVGLITHPWIARAHASPDGLIDDDGMVEIKCPNTATHIDVLLSRNIPDKYVIQCQWQMACAGRAWVDFVSFDDRMPERMQLFVCRIVRDQARIGELEREVSVFLDEVAATVENLMKAYS